MTMANRNGATDDAREDDGPLIVPPGRITFERITALDPALFQPVFHVSTSAISSLKAAEPPTMELKPVMKHGRPVEDYGFADLWVNADGAKYARMSWNGIVQSFRVQVEPALGTWRVDEVRFVLHRELCRMLLGLTIDALEQM